MFEDPESSPYDHYSPRLHKHAAALVSEWCATVLFATRKVRTQTEDAGFGRKRTIAHALGKDGGERVLRCVGGPSSPARRTAWSVPRGPARARGTRSRSATPAATAQPRKLALKS